MYAEGTTQVTTALPDPVLAAVKKLATDEKRSVARMIAILVEEAITRRAAARARQGNPI
jgi:hypothetical protein